jgi:quercetin dioxygenase-like cupin family protein
MSPDTDRIQIRRPDELPTYGTGEFGSTIIADEETGVENVSVGMVEFDPGASGTRHVREVEEIVVVLEGETRIDTDEAEYHLVAGEAAIIPPGLTHQHHNPSDEPLRKLWIFSPQGPEEPMRDRDTREATAEDPATGGDA